MRNSVFAGLLASMVLGVALTGGAEAGCVDRGHCPSSVTAKKAKVAKHVSATRKAQSAKPLRVKAVHARNGKKRKVHVARAATRSQRPAAAASPAVRNNVVGLIQSMAPSHGVPTWFALKIAEVESNYQPHLRGRAGEYGVFQLKCATARGIGFTGDCAALLDPAVNVRYGLRHLALAMKASGGNLRLAASKHNGGLGRRTEVRGYVAKVF